MTALGGLEGNCPSPRGCEKMGNCYPHSLSFQFPVWPVWKPNGKWRLTVDCCRLSADTDPLAAEEPNISELTAPMQEQAHGLMTTADIKDMFCMVPWQQWGQHQLAFVYGATMYLHRASSGLQSFTHLSSPCAGKRIGKHTSRMKVYQDTDNILTGGNRK